MVKNKSTSGKDNKDPVIKTIADVAVQVMKKNDYENIGRNEFGLLDEVWWEAKKLGIVKEVGSRGGRDKPHPMNRQDRVINALDRDKRFEKFFIRCCTRSGDREVLLREFKYVGS